MVLMMSFGVCTGSILVLSPAVTAGDENSAGAQGTAWKVGDKVEAWNITWYKATVIEVGTGTYRGYYKVHYDDFSSASDQFLNASSIRARQNPVSGSGSSAPREGKYVILSYGNISNPIRLGHITLSKDTYEFFDNGSKRIGGGRYAFDVKSNTVKWLDGPVQKSNWGGEFTVEREGKTHKIRLNRVTVATNSTDSSP
jgi:hypothetical protein